MDPYSAGLFTIEPMQGWTVNGWIQIPPSFVIMLYCAIIVIAAVSFIYYRNKEAASMRSLAKSMIIAFFCSGFLYLVYSERTWYAWFCEDAEKYSGHTTEQKTRIFLGPLYDFLSSARAALKDDEYRIHSSDGGTLLMAEYYLLPKRSRSNAKNIIVLYDTDCSYDPLTKIFVRGGERIGNAELLYRYDSGAYILRTP